MPDAVVDLDSLKKFILDRTLSIWNERSVPYYLSFIAVDLRKIGVDYRTLIGPLKLSQWASSNTVPGTKLMVHPTQKARIGFVPADSDFTFTAHDALVGVQNTQQDFQISRNLALIQFVESLARLPDKALEEFSIPARTLIGILKG